MRRSERRPADLNLPFGALYPNSGTRGVMSVWVGCDAEICQSDAVRGVLAVGGGREGEDHGGFFVGASGVSFNGGGDRWRFSLRGGDGVVDGLETPR